MVGIYTSKSFFAEKRFLGFLMLVAKGMLKDKIHSNRGILTVGMNTSKSFDLKNNPVAFLVSEGEDSYQYRTRSNRDTEFQRMCTNRTFFVEWYLGSRMIKGKGRC